jgi:flavin-binding protein dodecin
VAKASETVRNLDWFEVTEVRGQIDQGRVAHYQVTLKIGFRLED